MADSTKRLTVIFVGDTAELDAAFKRVQKEAEETDASVKKSSDQMSNGMTKMGDSARILGIVLAGAAVGTAAIGIAAAATFAVMGAGLIAATAAVIGLGLYGSVSAKTLQAQFHSALSSIKSDFEQTVKPFVPQMQQIVTQFVNNFLQGFKNFMPAITNLLNQMLPIFQRFSASLPQFGTFFAGQVNLIVNAFSQVMKMSNLGLGAGLKNLINGLDTLIADLIKIGGPLMGPVFTALGNLASTLGNQLVKAFNQNHAAIQTLIVSVINIISNVLQLIPPIVSLVSHLSGLFSFIANNKWIVDALATAFIALKVAMFLQGAAQAFMGAMAIVKGAIASTEAAVGGLTGATRILQATIATPTVMGSIAVAGAIGDIALVGAAINAVIGAIHAMNDSANAAAANAYTIQRNEAYILQQTNSTNAAIALRATSQAQKMGLEGAGGSPRFAGGTNYAPGGWALVGEQGPELVNLPRGSQVMPTDQTHQMMSGGSGGTVNLTVNVGVVAGNNVQELAATIYRELQRMARANGFNGSLPAIGVTPTG